MEIGAINTSASLAPELASQLHRAGNDPEAQAKVVAQQFESVLLRQFLDKSMGSLMGGEAGGDVYNYMVTDALSQSLAKGGGLGMQSILQSQLSPAGHKPAPAQFVKGLL